MEFQQKQKQEKEEESITVNSRNIFALMIASLHAASAAATTNNTNKKKKSYLRKPNSYHQLQLQLLNQLHLSLLSKIPNPNSSSLNLFIVTPQLTLPVPILSLFPVLLTSKCAEIVCKCAEFIGAALLFSLEMNEQIANDDETVKGLISALASSKRRRRRSTSIAACNAVLDMSTTSIGRQRLLESSALDCLINVEGSEEAKISVNHWLVSCFLRLKKLSTQEKATATFAVYVPKTPSALVSLFTDEQGSESRLRIGFKEDELPVLLLDAAITLINTCKIDQLEKIPRNLFETFLAYLKKLWAEVRAQMLFGTSLKHSQQSHFCVSNIRTNNLAESIFRLSINADQLTTPFHMDVVKRSIFSWDGSSFEHFILNHWEVSPMLIPSLSKASNEHNDIFSSFKQSLNFDEAVPSFLFTILKNLISCPPIASDELDILSFLKEVRIHLGCPMVYQQDIRVLKTQHLKRERHFFQERSRSFCIQDPQFLFVNDIFRCKEAYKEGYTIALRGMEFRFGSIAAIVDGLAYLFGQPSAGVNMYLTPPNSQGLACHWDDHCVFVCQLVGVKQWKVFPQSSLGLPHLYESVDSLYEADRSKMDGYKHFLLREGDVLYIPRGFPHEACTVVDDDRPNETAEFSLHLTLAIEVEPPFEWEGFIHVGLQNWYQNQKQSNYTSCDLLSGSLNAISVNLMHVAIKLIGDVDPTFRKACLVGAISLLSDSKDLLDLNQRTIFSHLIKSIDAKSRFSDALRSVTLSLGENEDPLQRIRWLQRLDDEEEIEVQKWKIPAMDSDCFILICDQHKDKAEAAFMEVKSKFCREVAFEDVEQCYKMLLEKYRKVRKQYTSGMLSLHYN